MQKHLSKTRVLGYLLLLVMVTSFVFSMTYAKYVKQISGNASASVAIWGSDTKTTNIDVNGIVPGDEKKFEITITNGKGNKVSEVSQDYTMMIQTTGNLPLSFALTGTSDSSDSNSDKLLEVSSITFVDGVAKITGGHLPHTTKMTHTYTLQITWPKNANDENYMDEVDMITLTVDAQQSSPAGNTK